MPKFRIRLTASAPVDGWITVEVDDVGHALDTAANWVERDAHGERIDAVDAVQWKSMGYAASAIEVMTEADDVFAIVDVDC